MNRGDAERQSSNRNRSACANRLRRSCSLLALCICVSAAGLTCGSKKIDLRTRIPADTLIFLETNDLGAALQPIIDSKPFSEVAKYKPDISAIKGVQLAVAVTGFEMAEQKLTDEQSVGNIRPHFVAVADTNAWNWQAVAFAEKKLGGFVADIYDSEPSVERSDKYGGNYFRWTAKDGRRAYALVLDSLIYFANDESAIDKCLEVKRGEVDSIAKAGKLPAVDPEAFASGYVGTDGIAQLANVIGLKLASENAEETEVQGAIADIVPELLRNSVASVTWNATKSDKGISDRYTASLRPDTARILTQSLQTNASAGKQQMARDQILNRLPVDCDSATRYAFKTPQLAWRSILLTALNSVDQRSAGLLSAFSNALFAQYGIADPEKFLASLGNGSDLSSDLVSFRSEAESEPVILAVTGKMQDTVGALGSDLRVRGQGEDGYSEWETDDGDLVINFEQGPFTMGSQEGVNEFKQKRGSINADLLPSLAGSDAPITTVARDTETVSGIVEALSEKKSAETKAVTVYVTETRFNNDGIERRTVSDFGLIGSIIAQLSQN